MGDAGKQPSGAEAGEGVSDASLVRRCRSGSADAATLLYFRYAEHLQNLARTRISPGLATRVEAEDIVQSVFRTFFRRVRLGQYAVPEGDHLWRLFLIIALNKIRTAATHHSAARRDLRKTTAGDAADSVPGEDGRQQDALTILQLMVEEILGGLPPLSRTVIERRIEGYQVAEIAVEVQRSKRTVERILREFQDHLRASVTSDG